MADEKADRHRQAELHTPTTNTVRTGWSDGHPYRATTGLDERLAEFDRWLAQHDREVREQIASEIEAQINWSEETTADSHIYARAAEITRGAAPQPRTVSAEFMSRQLERVAQRIERMGEKYDAERAAGLVRELLTPITVAEAGEVSCTCGFGGVHEPTNPRCERNGFDPTSLAGEVR